MPIPRGRDSNSVSCRLGPIALHARRVAQSNCELRRPTSRGGVVRLSIAEPKHGQAWEIALTERELKQGMTVSGPAGLYELMLQADGHVRFRKPFELRRTPELLVVKLEALPALTGRVVDRVTKTPIAGVLISTDTERRSLSNGFGQFAMPLDPDDWPSDITFSAGGYAQLVQPMPKARAATSFGDVYLNRAGSVAVRLQQPDRRVVAVELHELLLNGRKLGRLVKSVRVSEREPDPKVLFEGIEPGDYLVLAKGAEEWERLAEPVAVTAAETSSLTLQVTPLEVRLHAFSQGEPLAEARVVLRNRDMLWQSVIATDSNGIAKISLWQGGRMNATVEAAGMAPYMERRTIDSSAATEWSLNVPNYEISGVVVDAKTGKPVPGAAVALTMESVDGYMLSVKTRAIADGTFRFSPVAYGTHTLKAGARGYPPAELSYEFNEPEQHRRLTLTLESAAPVKLIVTDARGTPIEGARVIDFAGLTRTGMAATDSSGGALVMVPDGQTRDVYVVPRDGSFAMATVSSGARDTSIRTPMGVSRLLIRTESEKGEPIPDISVVIRYNGRILPFEVIQALAMTQGAKPTSTSEGRISFDHMPVGSYEFWPVGSPAELRALSTRVGPNAPLRIVAGPGENVAVMTFAPTDEP